MALEYRIAKKDLILVKKDDKLVGRITHSSRFGTYVFYEQADNNFLHPSVACDTLSDVKAIAEKRAVEIEARIQREVEKLGGMDPVDAMLEEIAVHKIRIDEIQKIIAPFEKKISGHTNRITSLKRQIALIELNRPKGTEEEIEYFLFEDGRVDRERYTARQAFWSRWALKQSGYNPYTNQIVLKIDLIKNSPKSLAQHAYEIKKLLLHIKPYETEGGLYGNRQLIGYKVFGVNMHQTNDYSPAPALAIKDNEYNVVSGKYSPDIKPFATLKEALEYLQQKYWARKK